MIFESVTIFIQARGRPKVKHSWKYVEICNRIKDINE